MPVRVSEGQQGTLSAKLCTTVTTTTPTAGVFIDGDDGTQLAEAVAVSTTTGDAVTFKLQGSLDGTRWYDIGYQLIDATAAPARAVAGITLTTGTNGALVSHVYQVLDKYPYMRVNPSANNLATGLTVTLHALPV